MKSAIAESERKQLALEAFDAYASMLYGVAFNVLGVREDAEDAVQTAFVRFIDESRTFEGGLEQAKAWLIVATRNAAKDACRRLAYEGGEASEPTLPSAMPPEDRMDLHAAMRILNEPERQSVMLKYYQGYSAVEIAHVLECPAATVRSHLLRARRKLAKHLGVD